MHRNAVLSLAALALAFGGCGGDPPAPTTPEAAAEAWVEAVNGEDWDRACDLSVKRSADECEAYLRGAFAGAEEDVTIEGAYLNRAVDRDRAALAVDGLPPQVSEISVERRDRRYLVHFEVQILR